MNELASFEIRLGRIFRAGARVALFCFIAQLAIVVAVPPVDVAGISLELLLFHAGMAALLSIPVLRIVFSGVAFFRTREWGFFAATVVVSAVIALAFASAARIALT